MNIHSKTFRCQHKETETAPYGGVYCLDCGERVVAPPVEVRNYSTVHSSRGVGLQNFCGVRSKPNWTDLREPGWSVELGRTYIGARYNGDTRVWMIGRVVWCDDCGHFEVEQRGLTLHQRCHAPAHVTHLAPDLLGCPASA